MEVYGKLNHDVELNHAARVKPSDDPYPDSYLVLATTLNELSTSHAGILFGAIHQVFCTTFLTDIMRMLSIFLRFTTLKFGPSVAFLENATKPMGNVVSVS